MRNMLLGSQLPHYNMHHPDTSVLRVPDTADQCQLWPSALKCCSKIQCRRFNSAIARMVKLGESVDIQGIQEHVRLGPKLSGTVKGKLSLGIRILQVGGVEKAFRQSFNIRDDEKLSKASQCDLSTTAGRIAELLFVSDYRVAFCSERSIKVISPTGKLLKVHYQAMIPVGGIRRVSESANVIKPTQKYVQLVTEDNFEF